MCGILGIIGAYDPVQAQKALALQHHRGPDHTGIYSDTHCFLGHNRLAIIDLHEEANQPMRSGSHAMVYNGEIYNYAELKKGLEHAVRFKTRSDTEVLLESFLTRGTACFESFNGMFALGIYDATSNTLTLARDRFGKKPLYYAEIDGAFCFASEIKALLALMLSTPQPDKQAFLEYLSVLSAVTPKTMYEGIYKLPAGSVLTRTREGAIQIDSYYDPSAAFGRHTKIGEQAAIEQVELLLQQSIEARLVADVDVASFLSGGLDSSLISALYARMSDQKIHTFSIGYDTYRQFDETEYARVAAAHIGSEHHEFIVGRDAFAEAYEQVVYHMDEPITDSACIPTYLLSQKVHESGIKTILSGEGSDEVFVGYKRALESLQSPDSLYRTVGENYGLPEMRNLLSDTFGNPLEQAHVSTDALHAALLPKTTHPLDWANYADLKLWLGEMLMMKMDKMSMAFSLESRAPFLDYRLVDFVLGLSPQIRIGRSPKHLLKQFAGKYLPDAIVSRRKKGFSSPFLFWHFESFGDSVQENLLTVNRELGWFKDEILYDLVLQGKKGLNVQLLWAIILFSHWYRTHYMR